MADFANYSDGLMSAFYSIINLRNFEIYDNLTAFFEKVLLRPNEETLDYLPD